MSAKHDEVEQLAQFYRHLATAEFDGYCDLYAHLARKMADETELLGRLVDTVPATKVIPVLLNAAVHDQVLADPTLDPLAKIYDGGPGDAWPLYRDLLETRFDDLTEIMRNRSIQTNEVGRSAVLLPALTLVQRAFDRPLALVELGPSAGLNLLLDRFGYDYGTGAIIGDATSPVQLDCAFRGNARPPLPNAPLPIATRQGIDLSPIDVRDDEACRWLQACLWPGNHDRSQRLAAAIELGRTDPPQLDRGNAVDLLPGVLAAIEPDLVPCVLSTWVLAYFSKDERAEIGRILTTAGAGRDLAMITAEYPSIAPWITTPDRPPADNDGQAATVLGLRGVPDAAHARPLAWTHAHGRWIDWL